MGPSLNPFLISFESINAMNQKIKGMKTDTYAMYHIEYSVEMIFFLNHLNNIHKLNL